MTSNKAILCGHSLVGRHSLNTSIVAMGEPKLECLDQDSDLDLFVVLRHV